jgi:hypothetical protein
MPDHSVAIIEVFLNFGAMLLRTCGVLDFVKRQIYLQYMHVHILVVLPLLHLAGWLANQPREGEGERVCGAVQIIAKGKKESH